MPETNIEIIIPTSADSERILGLARSIDLFRAEDIDVIDELWTEFVKKGDLHSWYHFIATHEQGDDGKILGFACYGQRPLTEGTFDLYWIAVDGNARGRGIGKTLLGEVEEQVRTRGGRLLIAETEGKSSFTPTRRFYLSAGYTLEARIRDFYRPGEDLVVFTKRL
jgi:ribosomal protein S18 acetylase RimI-like enzyme